MLRISISNLPEKPINGEEMAISRVGKELFEMLIKPYTKKQWNKYPSVSRDCHWAKQNKKPFQFQELDAEVFTRLPYRENRDDRLYTNHMTDVFESFAPPRYFDDPWQHLPKDGYTRMFENMLLKVGLRSWTILLKFFFQDPKITVRVATDYFEVNTLIAFRERERKRDVKIFLSLAFADSTFSNQDHRNNRLRWKSSCLSTSCSSSPDPSMPTSPARLAEFSCWTFILFSCVFFQKMAFKVELGIWIIFICAYPIRFLCKMHINRKQTEKNQLATSPHIGKAECLHL